MSQSPNQPNMPTASNDDVMCTPNEAEVFEFEKYRQDLVQADTELKMCIDKVLDLRVQAAELEASLTSFYCPTLQAKLRICQELSAKCEEQHRNYQTVEKEPLTGTETITGAEETVEETVGDAIMEVDLTTLPN